MTVSVKAERAAFADPPMSEVRHLVSGWLGRLLIAATATVVVLVRLVEIDRAPGELYGDIAIVYRYVQFILSGRWPIQFVLSAGPLYHYAIIPVIWLVGLSYLGLKLASVVVSLILLVALYALASELHGPELGLLSVFVAGVSSWLLIFSRLGNSQILVPLLTVSALLLALRSVQSGRKRDTIACALVSACGLYTYPQTFILPPVIFVTLLCLPWQVPAIRRSRLGLFMGVTLLSATPFALIVAQDPANFFTGYIGGKLAADAATFRILSENVGRALLAFHLRGDAVFRSNPAAAPHLDFVSGILFVVGVFFWLAPARRRLSPIVFVPLLLLQAPSILVLSNPEEVPSASRTLGVAPLAYLLVASGVWRLAELLRPVRAIAVGALCASLLLIFGANMWRYFGLYVDGLPNHNTAFGRIIAEYIDELPPNTPVYIVGCCWGDYGQPEPDGVKLVTKRPETLHFVDARDATCDWLDELPRPAVLIWSPRPRVPSTKMTACAEVLRPQLHSSRTAGPIFNVGRLDERLQKEQVGRD